MEFSGNSEINKFIEDKLSKFDEKRKEKLKLLLIAILVKIQS